MEKIIFRGIVGSQAHGTAGEGSDVDIATIYMCDNSELLGLNYKEQDDIDKDNRRYELNKFIKLLMVGNPNMLEIMNLPEDCILETSPEWNIILEHKDLFLTKQLRRTFSEYAKAQISKAKGLNKKINWEKDKTERKDVLDFCYFIECYLTGNSDTVAIPVKKWLLDNGYLQEQCGLVGIEHLRYCNIMYIDERQGYTSDNPRFNEVSQELNFKGIVQDINLSNDISTSSVPKYCVPKGILYFNKDGYSSHCKDYKEYQTWLEKRNPTRYETNKKHGQEYDSKNLSHVVRLLKTARDIVESKKIIVRRTEDEIDYLVKIKKGEVNLDEIVQWAENEYLIIEQLFEKSDLPDEVNQDLCNQLILKIRNV